MKKVTIYQISFAELLVLKQLLDIAIDKSIAAKQTIQEVLELSVLGGLYMRLAKRLIFIPNPSKKTNMVMTVAEASAFLIYKEKNWNFDVDTHPGIVLLKFRNDILSQLSL